MAPAGTIATLTLNPAVDVSSTAPAIVPAHKLRCRDVRHDAGGGGINVARVLARFAVPVHAVFASGGPMGQLLERLVAREAVSFTAVAVAGDTREDFTVRAGDSGAQFRFVLPGPVLDAFEIDTCLGAFARAAAHAAFAVAGGSLPPGAPPDTYRRAIEALPRGVPFALDTSGDALARALGPGLTLIKPSRRELEALAGHRLADRAACAAAARRLVDRGSAEMVAATLGAEGAILAGRGFTLDAFAPSVVPVSTIGAGDSFLAALLRALVRGARPADALRMAVAAGTAALLTPGTGLCRPADVEQLLPRVRVDCGG